MPPTLMEVPLPLVQHALVSPAKGEVLSLLNVYASLFVFHIYHGCLCLSNLWGLFLPPGI